MVDVPWDADATASRYAQGLPRQRADFTGASLRDAVIFVLAQTNSRGDGYKIRLDDGSQEWEGPQIVELGHLLPEA